MPWEDWELHATIRPVPPVRSLGAGYSAEGVEAFARIDRAIAAWYTDHGASINGLYIFHYRDVVADSARISEPAVEMPAAPFFSEFLRLRFRLTGPGAGSALEAFRLDVAGRLGRGPSPVLKGWRRSEGYDARSDVGARYGDLAGGVDPTEIVVRILTANTELRFLLLDHPAFAPNHDITHLYLSTMCLTLAEEAAALRACIGRVAVWDESFRERVVDAAPRQE